MATANAPITLPASDAQAHAVCGAASIDALKDSLQRPTAESVSTMVYHILRMAKLSGNAKTFSNRRTDAENEIITILKNSPGDPKTTHALCTSRFPVANPARKVQLPTDSFESTSLCYITALTTGNTFNAEFGSGIDDAALDKMPDMQRMYVFPPDSEVIRMIAIRRSAEHIFSSQKYKDMGQPAYIQYIIELMEKSAETANPLAVANACQAKEVAKRCGADDYSGFATCKLTFEIGQ